MNILISNPPYLNEEEMYSLEKSVSDYEPHLALNGGEDGLSVYREIADFLARNKQASFCILLEASPTTAAGVKKILKKVGYESSIVIDRFGVERFVITE